MTTEPAPEKKPRKMLAKQLRQTMYWLALDWIHLRGTLPTPPRGENSRVSNTKEYGHPAEWASDNASDIVAKLTSWHDMLAEHRNERPPTIGIVFGNSTFNRRYESTQQEKIRLVAAWKYLEPRCEQLVELVDYDDLKELPDLHGKIRRALGASTPKYTLPVPCPNNECELLTLVRVQGIGQEFITCDSCGYTIKEVHYPFLVRMTLDAYLNGAASAETDSTTIGELTS